MGCSGFVYEATIGERVVALKLLVPRHDASEQSEIQTAEKFHNSPNIIKSYGTIPYTHPQFRGGGKIIVFEKAEETLSTSMLKPIEEAVRIRQIRDILNGIHQMHIKGYLHSDNKTDNFLILSDGTAVVADLGGSRSARPDELENENKELGRFCRTLKIKDVRVLSIFDILSRDGDLERALASLLEI